jgi:1,4-alpha-glucan branching enzyme
MDQLIIKNAVFPLSKRKLRERQPFIIICNFTEVVRENYRIGIPKEEF